MLWESDGAKAGWEGLDGMGQRPLKGDWDEWGCEGKEAATGCTAQVGGTAGVEAPASHLV